MEQEKEIREKIIYYLKNPQELKETADKICRESYGDAVFLRGLIEFSNYCAMDCLYCGIRHSNTKTHRYKLSVEEITETAAEGYKRGLKTFVLQSGEDATYSLAELCRIVEQIKDATHDEAAITLSCGIKKREEYAALKSAGADRYLLRFETSHPDLHRYLRHGMSLKRRLEALSDLKELGFETGSGFMTGLPGEDEVVLVENIVLCWKYQFDMVGIGPFIPHDDTPLKGSVTPDITKALAAVGLVRIVLPLANIPATTAAGSLDPLGREKMLEWGANVLMPNITPVVFKKDYLLYPGKICLDESGFECVGCLEGRVTTVNKKLSFKRGDSLAKRNNRAV